MLTGYDTPEAVCGELMEENRKLSAENKSLKEKIKALEELIKVLKGKVKKRADVATEANKDEKIKENAMEIRKLVREHYWKDGLKVISYANNIVELTGGFDDGCI